ncbi:MAG: hypothetical protein HKP40_06410 [Litoreibacter sp.]|nr:hypothetical protein [Litoreibacter sp.]
MKALFPACAVVLAASPVTAHVGHLGELAGHGHWVAGAAIGIAAAITLWGALKGDKATKDDPETTEKSEGEVS